MIDAVFVCVNYNNSIETMSYINHINNSLENKNFEIVIVDNSNDIFEFNKLLKFRDENLLKNIFIIKSEKNLGYFTGMQFGIDYYVKNIRTLPKTIIICNTDIEIISKNILFLAKDAFKNHDIVALAPKIMLKKDFKNQNPFLINRPTYKKLKFLKYIYRNNLLNNFHAFLHRLLQKNFYIKNRENNLINEYIYAPHGSFIIINSIFFEKGGSLKYKGFLFGEEIYLGEQILKLGMKIKYFPKISIIHNENSVTKLIEKSQKRLLKLNSINFLIKYLYNI